MRQNYRKSTRTLRPVDSELVGKSHKYGHASARGVGIHVYDVTEPDRPASVLIEDKATALELINMLRAFVLADGEGE
jgi:hypothetical protein